MFEMLTIAIKCPTCGTLVETLPDVEKVICVHCGTLQSVHQSYSAAIESTIDRQRLEAERAEAIRMVRSMFGDVPQPVSRRRGSIEALHKQNMTSLAAFYAIIAPRLKNSRRWPLWAKFPWAKRYRRLVN